MKLETFFEKFEQFAEAPNALAKMRELVLHLAVRGRLVTNCRENPLSAEQITSEKEQALRELCLRTHPETARPSVDDFPFVLPKSWHAVNLGDLVFSCPTSYGEDPSPSLVKAGVVKVGNIDNRGGFKGQFSERGFPADEIKALLAQRGDLMVVKSSGSAENVHSGKTALCTAEHDGKIVGSNFVLRLRLFGTAAIPEYVWRVLTSRHSRAWVEQTVQTMTYPNLKWSDFAKLPIPLPPLAEQKRIVVKVDELMALCDRLETQQQERDTRHATLARASLARFADAPTSDNLDFLFHNSYTITPADLHKTILTLAVQGKLVPQDVNDETAVDSLRLCGAKKTQQPVSDEEQRHTVPDSWTWIRFSDVGKQRLGKMLDAQKNRGELKPYLRNTNVQWMRFELDDVKAMRVEESEADELRLKKGDLLICEGGEPGRCAIWNKDVSEMYFQKALHRVRPCAAIISEFLALNLQVDCQNEVLAGYFTGATIKHLTGRSLSEYPIPIPPLAEQHRIVAKVDQLMTLVDQLETQLVASRAAATNLMEAVVAELTARNDLCRTFPPIPRPRSHRRDISVAVGKRPDNE